MSEEKAPTPAATTNDMLIGQKLVPLGRKMLHVPNLLRGYMALRTATGKYVKGRKARPISEGFKNILVDIIFKNKFDSKDYYKLDEQEQLLFDDTCVFCGINTHSIAKLMTHTSKSKAELIGKFDVLKGELLAGSNAPELLKEMRNILLELKSKDMISRSHYDKLISEIVACI